MDVGIRGMDLAYALLDDYDAVIFVDLAARGGAPGTLYLIDPGMAGEGELSIDTHGMDPVKVLSFAQALGAGPRPTYIVACEPQRVLNPDVDQDVLMELSEPVRLAVPEAVRMVESLVRDLAIKEGKVDSELEQNLQVKGGVV
jgi:hydrogenase maturation protease